MDYFTIGALASQGVFWAACIVIVLVVLIFRRVEAKKSEDLDEYDN